MKLPPLFEKSLAEKLLEFDSWITPSLGSINETQRFKTEINDIVHVLEVIGEVVNKFSDIEDFCEQKISDHFIEKISNEHLFEHLLNFSKLLFLVTGKSDNNIKCQFPVYLNGIEGFPGYPVLKSGKLECKSIPRVIKSESLMELISKISIKPEIQRDMLSLYVQFILNDDSAKSQFWAFGHSYFNLKKIGKEKDLLMPIVQFQIRGSVSASGGHIPERILRNLMKEWGLREGIDFNNNDIVVSDLLKFLGV